MLEYFWLLLVIFVSTFCEERCDVCTCSDSNTGEVVANCRRIGSTTSENIRSIPDFSNWNIFQINLDYQPISILLPYIFLKNNLRNVHKIFMVHCELQNIDKNALRNLSKLEIFNCAQNNITEIQIGTFNDNLNLKGINMNSNNIRKLENGVLDGLQYLKTLNLDHNKINYIGDKLFIHNKRLEMLKLSHNELKYIDGDAFPEQLLPKLTIFIHDNPWECNCKLWNFHHKILEFVNNISMPMCSDKPYTRSKKWVELKETDFVCDPEIKISLITDSKNIILSCEVLANPAPSSLSWFQVENNRKIYIPKESVTFKKPFTHIITTTIPKKSLNKRYYNCMVQQKKTNTFRDQNISTSEILVSNEADQRIFEKDSSSSEEVLTVTEETTYFHNENIIYLNGGIGQNISFPCKTEKPENVQWYFKNFLIDNDTIKESNYKFKVETGAMELSTLTIRNISQMEKGLYSCVTSKQNKIIFDLHISPDKLEENNDMKTSSNPVIPIILGTIFFILLMGFIYTVYYFKKRKQVEDQPIDYETVDTNNENEYCANRNEEMVESSIYISSDNNIYEDIK